MNPALALLLLAAVLPMAAPAATDTMTTSSGPGASAPSTPPRAANDAGASLGDLKSPDGHLRG